ncbi:hypothetical protein BGX24_001432 [Mortierella sp. AD032]|nr:hypothetical protein BGX24_001432 [Mortierella sp. AD032]
MHSQGHVQAVRPVLHSGLSALTGEAPTDADTPDASSSCSTPERCSGSRCGWLIKSAAKSNTLSFLSTARMLSTPTITPIIHQHAAISAHISKSKQSLHPSIRTTHPANN